MAIISKTGITDGGTIQSEHITRIIDALSGLSTDSVILTGSLNGTASFATTASYALNATTGTGLQSLQFTHGAWITASATPAYYGNYAGIPPSDSETRMGVASPFTGTLVSASISGYIENPSGANKITFFAVRETDTIVSKSLSVGVSDALDTSTYYSAFNYVLNPEDMTPFTTAVGNKLSIKIVSNGTIDGLNAHTTVTLLFRP